MNRRARVIFMSLSLLAFTGPGVVCTYGDAGGAASKPAPVPATYDVKIAGYVKGSGSGDYSGTTLSITATVEDENGNKGDFVASGLTIDDKSHFHGTGTVLGKSMKVSGRLDDPKPGDTQLKARRVVGSFVTSDSHYGRIAGYVSGSTPASTGTGGSGGGGSGNGGGNGNGNGGGNSGGNGNGNGGGNGNGNGGGNGGGNGNGNGGGNGGGSGDPGNSGVNGGAPTNNGGNGNGRHGQGIGQGDGGGRHHKSNN